ncbi:MAG: hypothetical protein ACPGUV_04600, partial [Polyangiales bacterium]
DVGVAVPSREAPPGLEAGEGGQLPLALHGSLLSSGGARAEEQQQGRGQVLQWRVRQGGRGRWRSLRLQQDVSHIAVPQPGTVTVELKVRRAMGASIAMRVPRAFTLEPDADRQRRRRARQPKAAPAPKDAWTATRHSLAWPAGRPIATPPLTLVQETFVGIEVPDDDIDSGSALAPGMALGFTSRPRPPLLFFSGGARSTWIGGGDPVQRLDGGLEWQAKHPTRRLRLSLDGRFEQGRGSVGTLWTGRGDARLWWGRWFRPTWLLELQSRYSERGVLRGDAAQDEIPTLLWTGYRQNHPRTWRLEPRLRWQPSRGLRLEGRSWAASNARLVPDPLERVGLGAHLDFGWPAWWLRFGTSLEYRPRDEHRADALWNPESFARLSWTLWPHANLGLQCLGSVAVRPVLEDYAARFALRLFWSRDRALKDVRPSRLPMKGWAAWHQDEAAARDYGAQGGEAAF